MIKHTHALFWALVEVLMLVKCDLYRVQEILFLYSVIGTMHSLHT